MYNILFQVELNYLKSCGLMIIISWGEITNFWEWKRSEHSAPATLESMQPAQLAFCISFLGLWKIA
jgi:hypothetical protein